MVPSLNVFISVTILTEVGTTNITTEVRVFPIQFPRDSIVMKNGVTEPLIPIVKLLINVVRTK